MENKITPVTKTGRAFNGFHNDAGKKVHAMEDFSYPSWRKALCGTEPGRRGNGWIDEPQKTVNCQKCLKKLTQLEK